MTMFQSTNYDVKAFGKNVTIPDADIAKIMYYIDCVCTVIEYSDGDIRRYRNYANWANMSDEEDRLIFILAVALSPDELEDKVFFNSPALCPNSNNQFYEIGQIRNQFLVVRSVFIGGQQRQVKKMMAYKQAWMQTFYFQPIRNLAFRFSPEGQRQEAIRREMISSACIIS
ncbi:unnamed protein product [Rotaria magnacalcarata]|uniref:Uncharacterized protein n=2 Tax=Rotaria magnacalcarata TaxID=392030 RepID=A0A816HDW4_9BILA|nr:unnamed protein product [Rotaria magnacalcarata]CAF1926002.1 unnamed protein product [Rotaria magnacalcarata]CAF1974461.1 unnamed protein product [Rotaria magnacalcarata]CAF2117553.1 unnamed protein product [Rotaria magnacalcarata]